MHVSTEFMRALLQLEDSVVARSAAAAAAADNGKAAVKACSDAATPASSPFDQLMEELLLAAAEDYEEANAPALPHLLMQATVSVCRCACA